MSQVWGPSSSRPVPRLLASLPCEDAAVSQGVADGRVTLQRVFFDLYADRFPAGFDRMTVANFWTGGEGTYRTAIRLVGPEGAEVARGEAELAFPDGALTVAQLIYFPGLALAGPGQYTVEVLLDGAAVHAYSLTVVGPPEPEEAADEQG